MIVRIKLWLTALVAAALAFMGIYFLGRQSGRTREIRRRVDVMQDSKEVQDEVNDMGNDVRRDDLARWMRDE